MSQTEEAEAPPCVHHEIIEPAHGETTVKGKCIKCGAVEVYDAGHVFAGFEGGLLSPSDKTAPWFEDRREERHYRGRSYSA